MKDKELENIVNNEFIITNDDQQSSNTVINEKVEESTDTLFTRIKNVLLYVGIIIAMFMVSLNTTVVAPAMSIIATELNALEQQTWVATAYLVVFNAVQPLAGKFSDIFGRKPIFLFGIIMFFIGSLINSLAPRMNVLIPGRSVQGFGGGFIMALAFIIITDLVPPKHRPQFQSLLTVIYGLASCVGPLIGGAFVDHVNWHWDFWLNVILSCIAFILILWLLEEPLKLEKSSVTDKIKRIDWGGTIFCLGFVCCLLLALSWGPTYGWNSAHFIGPIVAAAVSLIGLVLVETYVAKEPLMPGRVIFNPSVTILYVYMICLGLAFIGTLYFGPMLFQAVFGANSMSSGIRLIPYMVCLIVASVGSSYVLKVFPYIKAYIVFGAAINLLGYGLFFTVNESSSYGQQVGFLTFCGFCFGLSQSNIITIIQYCVEVKDIAVAIGLNNFFLILASSVGVAIYQVLLQTFLKAQFALVDPSILAIAKEHGALQNYLYIRSMPEEAQQPIIHAYYVAIHTVFIIPIAASGLALICSIFIKNVKFGSRPGPQKPSSSSDTFVDNNATTSEKKEIV